MALGVRDKEIAEGIKAEYQAKQQALVDSLAAEVLACAKTRVNPQRDLCDLGASLLLRMDYLTSTTTDQVIVSWRKEILDRLNAFVDKESGNHLSLKEAEQNYLLWKILEKILEPAGVSIATTYQTLNDNEFI